MKQVLDKIVRKRFGSMTRFAKQANLEYYDLQKLFAASKKKMTPEREKEYAKLIALAKATKNDVTSNDLTQEIRDDIKGNMEVMGGVQKFCEDHPGFNQFSVWQIINGRRKTVNGTVKNLLNILNIPH